MNLVCIENVVSAIRFLIDRPQSAPLETYIVSDDDDPANNFRDVEQRLMQELGIHALPLSRIHVPTLALKLALRAAGQTSTDPRRVYDGSLLVQAGFAKRATLAEGLTRFAEWFRNQR
jgi:nucleoside-diphosphate-sugar epimerase